MQNHGVSWYGSRKSATGSKFNMASIITVGGKWRAQVRRKGHPVYTKTFRTATLASAWATRVEEQIDAGRSPDVSIVGSVYTVGEAIDAYRKLRATNRPVADDRDRKSTRLNSSHHSISYAVF